MCRLFGFRAAAPSQVHRALVVESNALRRQSEEHPDGWGIAFYTSDRPVIARGVDAAFCDADFERLARRVESDTVVAHVRRASVGPLRLENTHPFQHGPWVFAHNGTVPAFDEVRAPIEKAIAPAHRAALAGDTDSERYFRLFLTELDRAADPLDPALPLATVRDALACAVERILHATRDLGAEPSLNAVVTNGRVLAAFRHGRTLHFSTHKRRCPERSTCAAFAPRCERAVASGETVSHLLVASEPIGEVNVWTELADGEFVGVDDTLRLARERVDATPGGRVAFA